GGATAAAVLDVGPTSLVSLTLNPSSLMGGRTATGTVTLSGPAPTTGAVVTLTSGATTIATVPASVTVPAGATSATFTVTVQPVAQTFSVPISATLAGVTRTAPLTVVPPFLAAVTLNPASITGGSPVRGTVTLDGVAAAGGVVVTLASDHAA